MNKQWVVLVLLVLGTNFACAASFDCSKASTKVEKMICADPGLSKLDEELGDVYSKAIEKSHKPSALKKQQRDWLKGRNGCVDALCVKQAYKQRLSLLLNSTESTANSESAKQDASDNQRYHFQLTKGAGTPVCDAYLKRLNVTEYESPPYCDRPENDSVEGFAKLNRVLLAPSDVWGLYPILSKYMSSANKGKLDWSSMELQNQLVEKGQFRMTKEVAASLQDYMDSGWSKAWTYDSYIDIDNDDSLDKVLVWHGYGVIPTGVAGTACGVETFRFPNIPLRQPQIAFVITDDKKWLDVAKTEKVFSHPRGGYHFYSSYEKKRVTSDKFRPIGRSVGIFNYKGTYYFDTFFDGWGDFEDKRRIEGAKDKNKNKEIINTLGVFLNKDGKTKQVCEYLMTDSGIQKVGGNNNGTH